MSFFTSRQFFHHVIDSRAIMEYRKPLICLRSRQATLLRRGLRSYFGQPGNQHSGPMHKTYFAEPLERPRRSMLAWWLGVGLLWTTSCIGYGVYKTETVPITGRRRYGGTARQNAHFADMVDNMRQRQGHTWEQQHDLQLLCVPKDDPIYQRARTVLDRLTASAGLRSPPWNLVVTKMQGE